MSKTMPAPMYQTFPTWMLECLASIGDKMAQSVLMGRGMRKFFS